MELAAEPLHKASDWLESYRRHWEESLDALARYLETGESKKSFRTKSKSTKRK
jgi:hypothetical protein